MQYSLSEQTVVVRQRLRGLVYYWCRQPYKSVGKNCTRHQLIYYVSTSSYLNK
jgi:hypothetical protein